LRKVDVDDAGNAVGVFGCFFLRLLGMLDFLLIIDHYEFLYSIIKLHFLKPEMPMSIMLGFSCISLIS